MPIYTFECVICGDKQDIRVPNYMVEGDIIKTDLCVKCKADTLRRCYTEVKPKVKGCTTPGPK
jgi:predicted nucleic acid-binding Zn ribbon protein